jgi:type VI secretion system protein VasD
MIAIFTLVTVAGGMKGCATADVLSSNALKYVFKPDPTIIQAKVKVAKDVNPDSRGRPSPVKTRFYLLKSASVFKSADFFQLKEQDRELLGDDLRVREEEVFKPGDREEIEISLPPEETPDDGKLYLGIMVGYWDLNHSDWRVTREIEVEETTEIVIRIDRSEVSIEVVD